MHSELSIRAAGASVHKQEYQQSTTSGDQSTVIIRTAQHRTVHHPAGPVSAGCPDQRRHLHRRVSERGAAPVEAPGGRPKLPHPLQHRTVRRHPAPKATRRHGPHSRAARRRQPPATPSLHLNRSPLASALRQRPLQRQVVLLCSSERVPLRPLLRRSACPASPNARQARSPLRTVDAPILSQRERSVAAMGHRSAPATNSTTYSLRPSRRAFL